ncbi:hypothetical protein K2173_019285 [Erythroxylum novogranatense]|uniref:RBR-type E3 ubiquitin transferase n=1 Tax=Erythroxylum novogranatense TaxID=1862640 RepID=A0AAV8ST64_9ROSI|nr:hypothetical protein K2173_019285 [Erythroxylum novogranatense]
MAHLHLDTSDFVDDLYLAAQFDQDGGELFPVLDSDFAQELQLQEALLGCLALSKMVTTVSSAITAIEPAPKSVSGEPSRLFCEICTERKEKDQMFRTNCDHSFCFDCMTKYVATKIEEKILRVKCPEFKCDGVLEIGTCRGVLPKEVVDSWEKALCEEAIAGAVKVYCPFRDCSAMLIVDDDELRREFECPYCHRMFCVQCNVAWHAGLECEEVKSLNKDDREREDLMLIQLAKNQKWSRCPNCKFHVERTEGCPHITCRCKFEFCYGCGSQWGCTGLWLNVCNKQNTSWKLYVIVIFYTCPNSSAECA